MQKTPTCRNNEFSSSEWLSRRNLSHIVSFTLMNWAACPLHAALFFLLPSFQSLLLFSALLFMGGDTLLSHFQLNWKHCTVSFPSSFHKQLPDRGSVSASLYVFHLCPRPHKPPHPTPTFLLPSPPCLGTAPGAQNGQEPKWRKEDNQPLVPNGAHVIALSLFGSFLLLFLV